MLGSKMYRLNLPNFTRLQMQSQFSQRRMLSSMTRSLPMMISFHPIIPKCCPCFGTGNAVPKTFCTMPWKKVETERDQDKTQVVIDVKLINHLERTSLVDFGNEEAIARLQEAIKFADTMFEVDTTGVEPLTTVLENESLYLREDEVQPTSRGKILTNASKTEEDYFVAPPGNIPLEPQQSKLHRES